MLFSTFNNTYKNNKFAIEMFATSSHNSMALTPTELGVYALSC